MAMDLAEMVVDVEETTTIIAHNQMEIHANVKSLSRGEKNE